MSSTFGRCELADYRGGIVTEPPSAHWHIGDHGSFLKRHIVEAVDVASRGPCTIREFSRDFLLRVADPRNLRCAWDHLSRYGGQSPGPNGHPFGYLENHEIWTYLRVIAQAIRNQTYKVGSSLTVRIPKGPGRGYRTLKIQNIEDRTVARAVVQIIQPLYDPNFDPHSYGFRPGRDRQHALAWALAIAKQEGRMAWLVEDLKNAFDRVPRERLFDLLRRDLPEDLMQLIAQFADNGRRHGVPQGNPLSPLLLNIYLDHFLDRPWRKLHTDIPLLRTADDLLVLCRTEEEARTARHDLENILLPTGMILKGNMSDSVKNLTNGDTAEWLGFQVDGRLSVTIAEQAWEKLRERLTLLHAKSMSPLRATIAIRSWLDQLGPCFPSTDRNQAYTRISDIARGLALDEIPGRKQLSRRWQRAYARWCRLRRAATVGAMTGIRSSACDVRFSAPRGRRDGAPSGAPSHVFSSGEEVELFTDGCCLPVTKAGGWAWVLNTSRGSSQRAGGLRRTTNNRAELLAVIHGLEALAATVRVRLLTDSEYIAIGITERLAYWKAQGWRCGSGRRKRPVKNEDLWRRLDSLLAVHGVRCEHVRGHSGNEGNEQCDRLARQAAEQGISQLFSK